MARSVSTYATLSAIGGTGHHPWPAGRAPATAGTTGLAARRFSIWWCRNDVANRGRQPAHLAEGARRGGGALIQAGSSQLGRLVRYRCTRPRPAVPPSPPRMNSSVGISREQGLIDIAVLLDLDEAAVPTAIPWTRRRFPSQAGGSNPSGGIVVLVDDGEGVSGEPALIGLACRRANPVRPWPRSIHGHIGAAIRLRSQDAGGGGGSPAHYSASVR